MFSKPVLNAVAEANDSLEVYEVAIEHDPDSPELPLIVRVDDGRGCWLEYEACSDDDDAISTIERFTDIYVEIEQGEARPERFTQLRTTVGEIDVYQGQGATVYVFAEDMWDHARKHVVQFGVEGNPSYTVEHVGGTTPF